MNKTVIIVLAILLLLLLGGGAYMLLGKNKSQMLNSGTNSQTQTEAKLKSGKLSLKDIVTAGVAEKCNYNDVSEDFDIKGTSYIASGKVRTDYSSTVEGKTTSGHMIFDGTTSYIWTDGSQTGFTMAIDQNSTQNNTNTSSQNADLNKVIDYNCEAWSADRSKFSPPSDVTFTQFSLPSIAPTGSSQNPTGNQNACASCNYLTGESKTQCLQSLNCN